MGEAVRRRVVAGRGWRGALALVAGLALRAAPLGGQDLPQRFTAGRFIVEAYAGDSVLASSLLRRAVTTDTFPGLPRSRDSVLIQLAPDAQVFRALVGAHAPEWGSAFAFPEQRRVVMQGRDAPSSAGDPAQVLRHELAHLALHEYLGAATPRWFDEGYASYAAGEWDREQVIAANVGLALGGFRSLAALDSGFAQGARRAEASYALAYRAVAELAAVDSRGGLTLVLRSWKATGSLDRALRAAHGLTLGSFEAMWQRNTRRRYGALAVFADVTVGAVVLLALIGPLWVMRRRRDRARLEALRVAEEEAARRERESALAVLLEGIPGGEGGGGASS